MASLVNLALVVASVTPAVMGHMSMFTTSMYGVGPAPGFAYEYWDPVVPLGPGWMQQDEWWFRGPESRKLKPKEGEVTELPAGGSIMIEHACHVAWTQYGSSTTEVGSNLDACPGNSGAYHSGDPNSGVVDMNLLSGCALAIADVDDIEKVTMDNLAIFSVNQKCVSQKQINYEIPAAMPACTGEKCICGWFWLANNGTANFYMTAFDCKVTGATSTAKIAAPVDPTWCDPAELAAGTCKTVAGAKRPLYAYNYPTNIVWKGNYDRPGYHSNWSFQDGAQNDIFEVDETAAAISSSAAAASQSAASASSASVASALQASMAAQLASRSAQGHVPQATTTAAATTTTPTVAAASTDALGQVWHIVTQAANVKATAKSRKSWKSKNDKRHPRDFVDEDDAEDPYPTANAEELAKRCSGLDHSCELAADVLFD
ncbi:hypothetical protein BCR35DRAFT_289184 [Leucosporidium creatinivorum]|uniref:Uncharacterized protein n=1 Tax=Leucosporidium creatinivorum TaxID=106004 RepID=A0A1Y2FYM3_9BASI|nr:hypothetical protein BCR35DRAFT_289184 [Leucosporidium creatinivorum]